MPPVVRRPRALGAALALALLVFAVEAPMVSANQLVSAADTGAVAFATVTAPSADVPDALAQEQRHGAAIGWHTTSNTSGRIEQRQPVTAERPTTAERPVTAQRPEVAARPEPQPTQSGSDVRQILRIARSALGAKFRMGATGGGNYFDCSGLVYRVYQQAGLLSRVGGARRGATSFYQWFKSRGLVSRSNGKPGDLVVYQHPGERVIPHMGIYLGNGRVISALLNPWGVSSHGLNRILVPFKAFLHVRIGR